MPYWPTAATGRVTCMDGVLGRGRILDADTDAVDTFTGGVTDDDQAVLVLVAE